MRGRVHLIMCIILAVVSITSSLGRLTITATTANNDVKPFKIDIPISTYLLAGAVARGVSIFVLYPLDTLKTRFQMAPSAAANLPQLSISVLYRGVFGSLFGQIPYGMLTFGTYEIYKSYLLSKIFPASTPTDLQLLAVFIVAAILGDLSGSFWLCPSEVIKQQVQCGNYPNILAALRGTLYRGNSFIGIGGLYKGYIGQISRDVPYRAIQLPSYELAKKWYILHFATNLAADKFTSIARTLSPLENLLIGIVAGSFSAALTTPLDVLKTRMMTAGKEKANASPQSVWSVLKQLYRSEGFTGLFAGLLPRVVYIGPSAGLFFLVFEAVKLYCGPKSAVK